MNTALVNVTEQTGELVALVEAARIVVDNARQGPDCCYRSHLYRSPHRLGSGEHCALCRLANAVEPFE